MLRNTAQCYLYIWVMEKWWLGGFRATGLCPMLGNSYVPFWPAERKIKRKEEKKRKKENKLLGRGNVLPCQAQLELIHNTTS